MQRLAIPAVAAVLFTAGLARSEELSPEVQLCLTSLREGERARAEKALGPLGELPLYRAQLDVDPAAREVNGKLVLTWTARGKEVRELHLRVTPNAQGGKVKLSNLKVNGQPASLGHPEPTLYHFELPKPLAPGAAAQVEVNFQAKVPKAPAQSASLAGALGGGGQGGDYGAFLAAPELMSLVGLLPAVPPSEADGSPIAGPSGIGDLALYEPSHWLVSVTVPPGYAVHAPGNPLGEVPEPGGKVRFSFGAAVTRDFPLFVTQGYQVASAAVEDVQVESHFLEADAKAGKQVLRYAVSALTEYQKRLGPYPYRRFRIVQARLTGGAGGMEFPGLITLSTGLYRGSENPFAALGLPGLEALAALGGAGRELNARLERILELTVAHEVAHQYFAGLVGSDPVGFPVVDEALSQYLAVLYLEWKHGKAAADSVRQGDLVGAYHLYRLSGGKDGPADRPTSEFDNGLEYGALVYGKAPLLHEAQRKLLGEAAFLKGLRAYLEEYRHRWACPDCLTRVLARQRPEKLKELKALQTRWWDESHGDEDLGPPNLLGLVRSMTGQGLDPEAAKLLEQLLPTLMGP